MIMGSCGLRPQEVGSLNLGKWSRTMHGLAITHKIDPDSKKRVKGTKTGYSKAVALRGELRSSYYSMKPLRKKTDPDDLIFNPKETDGGIQSDTSNKHFKAACKRAGVDRGDRTQYNLRHSFNTYAPQILDRKEVQSPHGAPNRCNDESI